MEKTLFDEFSDQRFVGILRGKVGRIILEEAERVEGVGAMPVPPLECVDAVVAQVLGEVNRGEIGTRIEDFYGRVRALARQSVLESRCDLN